MASAYMLTWSAPASMKLDSNRTLGGALGLPSVYPRARAQARRSRGIACSIQSPSPEHNQDAATESPRSVNFLEASASQAIALVVAGSLAFAPFVIEPPSADAAQGGGRVGGSAGFSRSRTAAPPPRAAAPQSRPNVTVAPSLNISPFGGGYYAPSPFFGGWGWSPFGFAAPVTVVAGGPGLGFFFSAFLFIAVASIVVSVITSIFRRD